MSAEVRKAVARWKAEGTYERYVRGAILDIGCGDEKITPEARGWDVQDGDAQTLPGLADASFDTVTSFHCLEHLRDLHEAMFNWWRVLRPGGHLIIACPDEDLYEQGIWPSCHNADHKHSFTISKERSWSPSSVNIFDLVSRLPNRRVECVRRVYTKYNYSLVGSDSDQTLGAAEAAVEFIVQKLATQPGHRHSYEKILTCPICDRLTLILLGVTKEGKIQTRCGECGWKGAV